MRTSKLTPQNTNPALGARQPAMTGFAPESSGAAKPVRPKPILRPSAEWKRTNPAADLFGLAEKVRFVRNGSQPDAGILHNLGGELRGVLVGIGAEGSVALAQPCLQLYDTVLDMAVRTQTPIASLGMLLHFLPPDRSDKAERRCRTLHDLFASRLMTTLRHVQRGPEKSGLDFINAARLLPHDAALWHDLDQYAATALEPKSPLRKAIARLMDDCEEAQEIATYYGRQSQPRSRELAPTRNS